MFKVGDKVEWTSTSNGSDKTKIGKVVCVILPGVISIRVHKAKFPDHTRMFDGLARDHESYLVEVWKNEKSMPSSTGPACLC